VELTGRIEFASELAVAVVKSSDDTSGSEQSMLSRELVLSQRATLLIGLAAGAILRTVQLATSIGSVDAYFWSRHVDFVERYGAWSAYHVSRVINHPPFGLEIALLTKRLGAAVGLHFFDSFRILQCVADLVTALALYAIARRVGRADRAWIALVFFLSPTAIFVSAFHCNSDPLMVMFIVLALLATVEDRPILAGLLIGAGCGVKIIAFVALPLLLFGFREWRSRLRFLITSALVGAAIFIPPIIVSGWVSIRNIFGYTGWGGGWGFPLMINLAGKVSPSLAAKDSGSLVTPFFVLSLLLLWSVEAWRAGKHDVDDPQRLPRSVALAFLLVLFLAPGFGVQYLIWILPCLAFVLSHRAVIVLHALVAVFAFWLYTSWAEEWPWVYADGRFRTPWAGVYGVVVWFAIGWAVFASLRVLYRRAP